MKPGHRTAVFFSLRAADGSPGKQAVTFTLAQPDTPGLIDRTPVVVKPSARGVGSVALLPGLYDVTVSGVTTRIRVPLREAPVDLNELIAEVQE